MKVDVEKSRKIYVDVTSTWESGVQTGIQRVVRQIVGGFLDLELDISFIVYQSEEFMVIPREAVKSFLAPKPILSQSQTSRRVTLKAARALVPVHLRQRIKKVKLIGAILEELHIKSIPEGSVKLQHDGAVILVLDIINNAKQINLLTRMAEEKEVELVFFSYDCNPILSPSFFPEYVRMVFPHYISLARLSSKVWAISQTAQRDIKEVLQLNVPVKYKWLPPTWLPICEHPLDVLPDLSAERYILIVASFVPSKNHEGFLRAMKSLHRHGVTLPKLYLVGGASWLKNEIKEEIDEARAQGISIEKFEDLADCCLRRLYSHALFTALPSFVEGFGLPIVESLSYGRPVLTSKATSTGELLSLPGTIGFSHSDAPDLESVLSSLIQDNDLLSHLSMLANENKNSLGTWNEYAAELYDFIMTDDGDK
jgi:glycosyltransferase involved in cell wall biosynthesis